MKYKKLFATYNVSNFDKCINAFSFIILMLLLLNDNFIKPSKYLNVSVSIYSILFDDKSLKKMIN